MKRAIIRAVIVAFIIIGIIYLYMVLAVNSETNEFKKFKKLEPDSIRVNDSTYYFNNKSDSNKAAH